jgi:hypothetical protein
MAYAEPLLANKLFFTWYEEATYKTRPADIDRILRVKTHDYPEFDTGAEPEHFHGGGRPPVYIDDFKKQKPVGKFTYAVIDGQFLTSALGACVTVGSDPYTHTITRIDGMMPSYSVQTGFQKTGGNVIMEFLGCRTNLLTLKLAETKLMADVEYLLATPQDGGDTFETPDAFAPSTTPYIFKVGQFSSTSLYSGPKARSYGFEWKMNNNIEHDHVMGAEYYPYDVIPGKITYDSLTIDIGIDDDSEWDQIVGAPGTSHDWSVVFTRGANDTLTISGTAKRKNTPFKTDANNVRGTLELVPDTTSIVVVDSIATYPWST